MSASRTNFYRDSQNGKLMGVCAGIADYAGMDVTLVRIGVAFLIFMTSGALIPLYFIAGLLAPKKPFGLYETPDDAKFWQGVRANPRRSTQEVRSKLREIDRRMADIETFYTSRNTQLADEIERLR